jgi:hypothetical protein
VEVEVEQALVVVYAPLRPSGCQAAAPLPDAADEGGSGSREGCFVAVIRFTEPVIGCVFLHYDPLRQRGIKCYI